MKKKILIIIGVLLLVLFIAGLVTSRYDNSRVRSGLEPKFVIKTISNKGDKVTYWGLGYKVIRYVGVSPYEPFQNSLGIKYGSWFMNYRFEDIKINNGEEQKEIVTTVAYANWAENDGGLSQDKNCLNSDMYIYSDFPRLPTFKFDSKIELDDFKNKYKDTFTMNQGYDEIASFDEVTKNYDDEFFINHSLILTYKDASSGAFRYGISDIIKNEDKLVIKVTKTNNPEVYTDDMSGWFLMAEVEKEYVKDCIKFDTQLWNEFSYNVTTIESNKVTINNGKNDYTLSNFEEIESFVDNCNNGIDDEIEITQYTIEGDPIIATIKHNGKDGSFKVIMDATQDKFGVQKIYTNEYDGSYKATISTLSVEGITYYDFNLVSAENEIHICRYNY